VRSGFPRAARPKRASARKSAKRFSAGRATKKSVGQEKCEAVFRGPRDQKRASARKNGPKEKRPGCWEARALQAGGSLRSKRSESDRVALALQHTTKPDRVATVFAGADVEATERARQYFTGYAPSSPSIGLLKDGKLLYMLERSQIENRNADDIAAALTTAFDKFCGRPVSA